MQNAEMMLSGLRGGVVLLSAAAVALIILSWAQPLFLLRIDALRSSLDQSLFTTHVYTPLAEKRLGVSEYYSCHSLIEAFRVAQFASICALIFACLTFVMSAFQSSPLVTASRHRERALCALPVMVLTSSAFVCQLVTLLVFEVMYGRRWCTTPSPSHAASSASSDSATCDPFDGCVLSFKEMGFVKRESFTLMWVALACAAAVQLCEMALWYVALRETEPAATLVQPTAGDVTVEAEAAETQPLL